MRRCRSSGFKAQLQIFEEATTWAERSFRVPELWWNGMSFFVGRELQNGVLGESQVKTEVNLKKNRIQGDVIRMVLMLRGRVPIS